MDEARIRALFQQYAHLNAAPLNDAAADDILAVLGQHGCSADETGPLDRVAASPTASAITRVVAELDPDSQALALALRQARSKPPRSLHRFARRGLAIAAGSGALALLFALTPGFHGVPDDNALPVASMPVAADDVISVISFESAGQSQTDRQAKRPAETIFSGSFDS